MIVFGRQSSEILPVFLKRCVFLGATVPASVSVSNGNSLGMNVRGMSAHGQDANFAGDRIRQFTNTSATGFVGPQISIAAMPSV